MKEKLIIDYKGLEAYLMSLKYEDIETTYAKNIENPKLLSAETMDDIEYFKMDKSKITLDRFIDYGQPFLVDCLGNDMSIVILSRRKYKTPKGRSIRAKFLTTIIDDCRAVFGSCINGYWVIPPQFIKYSK